MIGGRRRKWKGEIEIYEKMRKQILISQRKRTTTTTFGKIKKMVRRRRKKKDGRCRR